MNLCQRAGSFAGGRRGALVKNRHGSAPCARLASHPNPAARLV